MKEIMTDYKVKDISLAGFGRQEILLAEDEMPAGISSSARSISCLPNPANEISFTL